MGGMVPKICCNMIDVCRARVPVPVPGGKGGFEIQYQARALLLYAVLE